MVITLLLLVEVLLMAEQFGEEDVSRLQVDIDDEVKTAAKIEALKQGVTLSEFVEVAIKEYLKKQSSNKK